MKWFEIILVVLTLGTGIISLLDKLFLAKRRAARAGLLDTEPPIIDYCRSFFPVLAAVLILRSFIAEPYKIPSSSMMPNLLIGDFILVNKFAYGLRLPITNTKIIPISKPNRGDVAVFKPPHKPDENWIKRVIGLPGDRIGFHGDTLYINGEPVKYILKGQYTGKNAGVPDPTLLVEELPNHPHTILESIGRGREEGEGEWVVPPGQYFVMGDNRDNSEDSRFWIKTHFLPEQNLRGKAFLIWLNCENWLCKGSFDPSRIGTVIR
ncbi:signal peptidase I [Xylella fastidiosa subsp. morus]|jgi:signal peptidase I|nr:signal peptidase I [Xylella fastidiosa]ADN62130.1 signal peptidase I [Xylella fastidiosa subsp. fastidiosa GB514]KAF0570548.1 signal peptidase [Xylella fastidiosa subsp. fastidiosa Mus-1]ACB92791.1 signal peptidase I [Xylella fastidiosa M23]AIC12588.1 signal peptidase [Xylella fastidiosa MUL0034]EGO82450.1 Signal peptidase I LepB [Xylella fastidiosa EB92.1]